MSMGPGAAALHELVHPCGKQWVGMGKVHLEELEIKESLYSLHEKYSA